MAGVDRLTKALKAVEDEATDANVHRAAAETVAAAGRTIAPEASGATRRSIKASGTKKLGLVKAGGPSMPWVPPVHFGDPPPRPQGGYAPANPWLYRAGDSRADAVTELFDQRLTAALHRQGLK